MWTICQASLTHILTEQQVSQNIFPPEFKISQFLGFHTSHPPPPNTCEPYVKHPSPTSSPSSRFHTSHPPNFTIWLQIDLDFWQEALRLTVHHEPHLRTGFPPFPLRGFLAFSVHLDLPLLPLGDNLFVFHWTDVDLGVDPPVWIPATDFTQVIP